MTLASRTDPRRTLLRKALAMTAVVLLSCPAAESGVGHPFNVTSTWYAQIPNGLAARGLGMTGPQRIVSLSLASDEILVDLLADCKKPSALIAVSTFADASSASQIVERVKKITARVHSEPESVLKLKPDLVIAASFNRPELLDLLQKRKIPLVVLDQFTSHKDIIENIKIIGKATGCDASAQKMAATFSARIEAIRKIHITDKEETAISWSTDLSVMAGETLFDDLLTINHLKNVATIAGLKNWPRVSPEAIRKWNPDWIIIGCEEKECSAMRETAKSHPAWKNIDAIKKNKFIQVSPQALVSTSHFFGVSFERSSH